MAMKSQKKTFEDYYDHSLKSYIPGLEPWQASAVKEVARSAFCHGIRYQKDKGTGPDGDAHS